MNVQEDSETAPVANESGALAYATPPRPARMERAYLEDGLGVVAVVCLALACLAGGLLWTMGLTGTLPAMAILVVGTLLALAGVGCGIALLVRSRRKAWVAMSTLMCAASFVVYLWLYTVIIKMYP